MRLDDEVQPVLRSDMSTPLDRLDRLDRQSSVPLHAQAELLLRELIEREEYRLGECLPDEISLANRLAISRGTLRAAIGRLVQEGLIERRAGVGTRVRERCAESGIAAWRSFSREMAIKGIQVENYQNELCFLAASQAAVRALAIAPGTAVWRLERLRGWDGQRVLHTSSWFHPRLGLTGREDFSNKPLYEVIEAVTGAVVAHAREEFSAVVASAEMGELLAVKPGEPLLLRTHTVFDPGSRALEFCEVHYVSSRFALTMDMRMEAGG